VTARSYFSYFYCVDSLGENRRAEENAEGEEVSPVALRYERTCARWIDA
jgi:hypothetical protein